MASIQFNAENVDPTSPYSLLPAGEYLCIINESDLLPTKAGTGHYLHLVLTIMEGAYQNRKVFKNINVHNQNPIAEQIGQRELSQLCHAIGKLHITDSSELHNITFVIRLVVTKNKQSGEETNEIREFRAVSGIKPSVATRPAFTSPTTSAAVIPPTTALAAAQQPLQEAPRTNTGKPVWAGSGPTVSLQGTNTGKPVWAG